MIQLPMLWGYIGVGLPFYFQQVTYYYCYLFIICHYLEQVISYFPIIIATIIIILFIYLQPFCTMPTM